MGFLLFLAYNLLSPLAALLFLLRFALTPRRYLLAGLHKELSQRFGFPSLPGLKNSKVLWVHAASMGEVNSLPGLLEKIRRSAPLLKILITTTTATGRDTALKSGIADAAVLAPLDFYPCVNHFISVIRPTALIVVETEIWPNMLFCSSSKGIRAAMVNARISKSLFYDIISPMLRMLLSGISVICAQNSGYAARFRKYGAKTIEITGNIKYDLLSPIHSRSDPQIALFAESHGWQNCRIITAGCTHPGEEKILADAFVKIAADHPETRFVIVPRHPERAAGALQYFKELNPVLWSAGGTSGKACRALIVDATGLLAKFYACSDCAYVGGTLVGRGGHNLLEPAACAIPVIFGPDIRNTREAADMLLVCGGGFMVSNTAELTEKIEMLLSDSAFRLQTGANALKSFKSLQGATDKTLMCVASLISE